MDAALYAAIGANGAEKVAQTSGLVDVRACGAARRLYRSGGAVDVGLGLCAD